MRVHHGVQVLDINLLLPYPLTFRRNTQNNTLELNHDAC